jgi:uncharacterized phiE125 gp8 family phage protein
MSFLLAAPAEEPLSLAEAKAWLRLDADDEDSLVVALIAAARAHVEAVTRRKLVAQVWRMRRDGNSRDGEHRLPFAPLRHVVAVRILGAEGQPHALAPSQWSVVGAADDPRVRIASSLSGVIEIDAEFGYGAAQDTPAPLRQAIRALVAAWFEHRGDTRPPAAVADLLAPFVRARLS